MDIINMIFTYLGIIVAIVGLITSLFKKESIRNKILFGLIILSTSVTAYTSYNYNKIINEKLELGIRKQEFREEAQRLNRNINISYWSPGKSEGLMHSILILLENNKDLVPDSYKRYEARVKSINEKVDSGYDMQEIREIMEMGGEAAKEILTSIAR